MESAEEREEQLFLEWQQRLFEFVYRNRRTFTEQEWKWMKLQFDMEHLPGSRQEEAFSLAADGDTISRTLEEDAVRTVVHRFSSRIGGAAYRVTVTQRFPEGGRAEVYIRMFDATGGPVPHGTIIFPGIGVSIVTDERGRARMPQVQYAEYVRKVMGLMCSLGNDEIHPLEME